MSNRTHKKFFILCFLFLFTAAIFPKKTFESELEEVVKKDLAGLMDLFYKYPDRINTQIKGIKDEPDVTCLILLTRRCNGQVGLIKSLFSLFPEIDVNCQGGKGNTALSEACFLGYTEIVKFFLIQPNIEIDNKNPVGFTALMLATLKGNTDIVKILLDKGASPYSKDNEGCSALMWAIRAGHTDIVKMLLEKGAPVDSKDNSGVTASMLAAQKGQIDILNVLLKNGAELLSKDNEGFAALDHACICGNKDALNFLIDKGAELKNLNPYTTMIPISNGSVETIKVLLDHKDFKSVDRLSLFFRAACKSGQYEIAKILLDKGADINIKDPDGATVLLWTAKKTKNDLIDALKKINEKYNMNDLKDAAAEKARMDSIDKQKTEILKLVLTKGVEINKTDNTGKTALMYACIDGLTETVRILLSNGAKIDIKDKAGNTAMAYAESVGDQDIVKLLNSPVSPVSKKKQEVRFPKKNKK